MCAAVSDGTNRRNVMWGECTGGGGSDASRQTRSPGLQGACCGMIAGARRGASPDNGPVRTRPNRRTESRPEGPAGATGRVAAPTRREA
jgi:hypothetical protein